VSDFWGEFDYLGTVYQNTDRRNAFGDWIPQNPSMAQVRQNLTEYAILPNGSSFVKSRVPHIRSILIYGPKGVGKTMLAETIANELGAIFINLSPKILQAATIAAGKTGPTKLMHIAFQVAKNPVRGPAVIYIDECETILQGGKKKGKSGDGPDRFKKDLQARVHPFCFVF
jgi:ATP-dependent 26S proteasome regulatory subunit